MDEGTLDWIESNETILFPERPSKAFGDRVTAITVMATIERFAPKIEWYSHPLLADSIHGLRHTMRVIALAHVIAETIETRVARTEILLAAALHDLRRENDRQDPSHGQRAATWWLQNRSAICDTFHVDLVQQDLVFQLIRLHELPSEDFSPDDFSSYETWRKDVDALKLADALDRYRLPKAKWWIDDNKTQLKASAGLKNLAFQLMVRSERHFLGGQAAKSAVLDAVLETLR